MANDVPSYKETRNRCKKTILVEAARAGLISVSGPMNQPDTLASGSERLFKYGYVNGLGGG